MMLNHYYLSKKGGVNFAIFGCIKYIMTKIGKAKLVTWKENKEIDCVNIAEYDVNNLIIYKDETHNLCLETNGNWLSSAYDAVQWYKYNGGCNQLWRLVEKDGNKFLKLKNSYLLYDGKIYITNDLSYPNEEINRINNKDKLILLKFK